MILHDKKIVVIHPPKCGGVSVQNAFGITNAQMHKRVQGVYRHATLAKIQEKFPEIDDYKKYILVRSPYQRLVSMFFYANQVDSPHNNMPVKMYLRRFQSCEIFLHHVDLDFLSVGKQFDTFMMPCWHYGIGLGGTYDEDLIPIRCEGLNLHLQELFGISCQDVPHVNTSEHKHWADYYDQETLTKVEDYYKEDFRRYGYFKRDST